MLLRVRVPPASNDYCLKSKNKFSKHGINLFPNKPIISYLVVFYLSSVPLYQKLFYTIYYLT